MTDQPEPNPQASPPPRNGAGRRRSSLYRRVLALGAAAIIAAWLPFSVMYISAVNKQATPVAAISIRHAGAQATRVVTTASGATRVIPVNGGTASSATVAPTPVTTHVS